MNRLALAVIIINFLFVKNADSFWLNYVSKLLQGNLSKLSKYMNHL